MDALARKVAADGAPHRDQYLTFLLGAEAFAVGILQVREIIEVGQLTTVPMMPGCIRGVINLRGAVVPVLDLTQRFGRPPATLSHRSCIVIVEVCADGVQQVAGVLVDAVQAVLELADDQIEPTPSFGARLRSDFVRGMGKVNGGFLIVLEIDQVLALDGLDAQPEPAAPAALAA